MRFNAILVIEEGGVRERESAACGILLAVLHDLFAI